MALPARPYDPLYDTTYTVSGARDHYRQQTVAGGFMIEKAPEYPNMFSELPHFPATTFRLKNSDKVPGFVDRAFHADVKDPVTMTLRSQPDVVAGQQRFKYFRRPMLASAQPVLVKQAPAEPVPVPPPVVPEPASKTVGTQSDYRESEAQTLPWEPDVVLPDQPALKQQYLSNRHNCEGPELLQLKDLKFGDGLPPGLQEVRRIEKLRAKRAFEATLPPINDLENLPVRQRMIEEWEAREWDEREEEILGVQDERLDLIDQALQVREDEIEAASLQRVEERKVQMLQHKAPQFAAIQANRIKTMRQLIEARKYVERHRKLIKPTIVERYANFGSTTYAPVQREGRFPESKPQNKVIETEGFQPATLQGLAELEQFLPKKLLQAKAFNPEGSSKGKPDYKQRQEVAVQKDLKTINDLLDTARSLKGLGFGECWPAPLKDTEARLVSTAGGGGAAAAVSLRSQKPHHRKPTVRAVERPDTPELPPPISVQPAGEKEAAVVLLQRLLRGRAAQNLMYEGKVRRMELIKELQLEHTAEVYSRPEDRPPAALRLDALLGTMVCQLAVALTTQDDSERARLMAEALASAESGAFKDVADLSALHTAGQVPRSRQITPLRAADITAPVGVPAHEDAFPDAPQESQGEAGGDGGEAAEVDAELEAMGVSREEAEAAAVRIQAAFKGHKARQDVAARRAQGAALQTEVAGTEMQDGSRPVSSGDPGVAPAEGEAFDGAGYSEEHVAAVTKIQAVQRGRIARKQVQAKKHAGQEVAQAHAESEQPTAVPEAAGGMEDDHSSSHGPQVPAEEAVSAQPAEDNASTPAPEDGTGVAPDAVDHVAVAAAPAESASDDVWPSVTNLSRPASVPAPEEAQSSAADTAVDAGTPAAADTEIDAAAAAASVSEAVEEQPGPQGAPDAAAEDVAVQDAVPEAQDTDTSTTAAPATETAGSDPTQPDEERAPAPPPVADVPQSEQADGQPVAASDEPVVASDEPAAESESNPAPTAEESPLAHEATLGDVGMGPQAGDEETLDTEGAGPLQPEATLGAVGAVSDEAMQEPEEATDAAPDQAPVQGAGSSEPEVVLQPQAMATEEELQEGPAAEVDAAPDESAAEVGAAPDESAAEVDAAPDESAAEVDAAPDESAAEVGAAPGESAAEGPDGSDVVAE